MKFFIKLFAVVTNRLSELQMGWGLKLKIHILHFS